MNSGNSWTPSLDLAMTRKLLQLGDMIPRPGAWIGDFRLVRELGRGGMGVVFEAESRTIERRVALKLLAWDSLQNENVRRRFLAEAEEASNLEGRHNIVPVHYYGEHDGWPFFTMQLMRGGNLAQALSRRGEQGQARDTLSDDLRLIATIARAVHHAHERGLLHRDLKPANVLLDEAGVPYIGDFGLAKRIDGDASITETTQGAGTLRYMAPEQARGSAELTWAADVYSLGAILYEILTGKALHHGVPAHELLARVTAREPVPMPSLLAPWIPSEVERVCLKCLEKDPVHRYPTAAALADDLDCLVAGRPPSVPPLSRWGRVLHELRRHPRRTAAFARVSAAILALTMLVLYGWQRSIDERRSALATNAFIAGSQAGSALLQIREYADRVQVASLEPEIVALGEQPRTREPPPALQRLAEGFDAAFVVRQDGYISAQWPLPPVDLLARRYDFRDYFGGAKRLAERRAPGPYVARAFRSQRDNQLKFGISAPLYEEGRWVGVLVAIIASDSLFGKVRMQDSARSGRVTALLGPRDIDRADVEKRSTGTSPERLVFLVHDGLQRGEEVAATPLPAMRAASREAVKASQQLSLAYATPQEEADYRDPVRGFEGTWYAAFAPVGGTGYVVVVQSPRDAPARSLLPLTPMAKLMGGCALGVLLAIVGVRRRSATRRARGDHAPA